MFYWLVSQLSKICCFTIFPKIWDNCWPRWTSHCRPSELPLRNVEVEKTPELLHILEVGLHLSYPCLDTTLAIQFCRVSTDCRVTKQRFLSSWVSPNAVWPLRTVCLLVVQCSFNLAPWKCLWRSAVAQRLKEIVMGHSLENITQPGFIRWPLTGCLGSQRSTEPFSK